MYVFQVLGFRIAFRGFGKSAVGGGPTVLAPDSNARATNITDRRRCFRRRKEAREEYLDPHRRPHRVDASAWTRVEDAARADAREANRRTRAPLDDDETDRRRARRRDRSRNRMERARWVGIRARDRQTARRTAARVGSLVVAVAGRAS